MCEGFGLIVDKELKLYFSEPDSDGDCSHSTTLNRLGWSDNTDIHLRHFVRVQFSDWTPESFEFDEEDTLPGWAENNREEILALSIKVLNKCDAARAEFEKVRDAAWAEYEKVRDAAWAELIRKFSKIEGYIAEKMGG